MRAESARGLRRPVVLTAHDRDRDDRGAARDRPRDRQRAALLRLADPHREGHQGGHQDHGQHSADEHGRQGAQHSSPGEMGLPGDMTSDNAYSIGSQTKCPYRPSPGSGRVVPGPVSASTPAITVTAPSSGRSNRNQKNECGLSERKYGRFAIRGNSWLPNSPTAPTPWYARRSRSAGWADPDRLLPTRPACPSYSRRYAIPRRFSHGTNRSDPRANTGYFFRTRISRRNHCRNDFGLRSDASTFRAW